MHLMSRKPSERLLQITRRASFGRAVRPAPEVAAPAPTPAEPIHEEAPAAAEIAVPGDGVEGSRRRSPRVAVADEVGIRRIGSFNFQARLDNVSAGGCRVELIEAYEVGDRVIARLPQLEPLGARVCWTMGATAGIEFLSGMHPAVFDSVLLRLQPAPVSSADAAPAA
jgi:hypothetical protein